MVEGKSNLMLRCSKLNLKFDWSWSASNCRLLGWLEWRENAAWVFFFFLQIVVFLNDKKGLFLSCYSQLSSTGLLSKHAFIPIMSPTAGRSKLNVSSLSIPFVLHHLPLRRWQVMEDHHVRWRYYFSQLDEMCALRAQPWLHRGIASWISDVSAS